MDGLPHQVRSTCFVLQGNCFGLVALVDVPLLLVKLSPVWSLSSPASVGEDVPRRTSKLGFDITPLTAEQREEAAARLNAFQRCHPCMR